MALQGKVAVSVTSGHTGWHKVLQGDPAQPGGGFGDPDGGVSLEPALAALSTPGNCPGTIRKG